MKRRFLRQGDIVNRFLSALTLVSKKPRLTSYIRTITMSIDENLLIARLEKLSEKYRWKDIFVTTFGKQAAHFDNSFVTKPTAGKDDYKDRFSKQDNADYMDSSFSNIDPCRSPHHVESQLSGLSPSSLPGSSAHSREKFDDCPSTVTKRRGRPFNGRARGESMNDDVILFSLGCDSPSPKKDSVSNNDEEGLVSFVNDDMACSDEFFVDLEESSSQSTSSSVSSACSDSESDQVNQNNPVQNRRHERSSFSNISYITVFDEHYRGEINSFQTCSNRYCPHPRRKNQVILSQGKANLNESPWYSQLHLEITETKCIKMMIPLNS